MQEVRSELVKAEAERIARGFEAVAEEYWEELYRAKKEAAKADERFQFGCQVREGATGGNLRWFSQKRRTRDDGQSAKIWHTPKPKQDGNYSMRSFQVANDREREAIRKAEADAAVLRAQSKALERLHRAELFYRKVLAETGAGGEYAGLMAEDTTPSQAS